MTHHTNISNTGLCHILVIMGPSLEEHTNVAESRLLQRAVMLANTSNCELELFYLCSDTSFKRRVLDTRTALDSERQSIADLAATRLSEIAIELQLKTKGLKVRQNVRWDQPRMDAILRKIDQAKPDLVMKDSEGSGYIMGIGRNTDGELIRQSPVPIWFDKEGSDTDVPEEAQNAKQGTPAFDLEQAITVPEKTFDSPMEVATSDALSLELRKRILQAWQADIQAQMVAVDEGGPVNKIDISGLKEISAARKLLNQRYEKSHQPTPRMVG